MTVEKRRGWLINVGLVALFLVVLWVIFAQIQTSAEKRALYAGYAKLYEQVIAQGQKPAAPAPGRVLEQPNIIATPAAGAPGSAGADGAKGPKGDPGKDSTVPGPQGSAGPAGKDGVDGVNGADGAPGKDGADSTTPGPQGEKGPAGASCPDGMSFREEVQASGRMAMVCEAPDPPASAAPAAARQTAPAPVSTPSSVASSPAPAGGQDGAVLPLLLNVLGLNPGRK
jgi:hypothetical protein